MWKAADLNKVVQGGWLYKSFPSVWIPCLGISDALHSILLSVIILDVMAPDVNSLFSKALAYFASAMEALLKGKVQYNWTPH